jgi:hypothetical protein
VAIVANGQVFPSHPVRRNTGRKPPDLAGVALDDQACCAEEKLTGWRLLIDEPALGELLQAPRPIGIVRPASKYGGRNGLGLMFGRLVLEDISICETESGVLPTT